MVQDLPIINEAVVSLHPTISNPYVILGEIPPSAKWFTVLDIMTWTVLPQGFSDSPYLFGQAFSWDLLNLHLGPNGKIVQYVDDLLICSPDEKNANLFRIYH